MGVVAECISDAVTYVLPCTGQPDLRHADGVFDQRESGKHLSGGSRIFRCHHDLHYAESVQIFQRSLQKIR